jgi:hypothetical protein
MKFSILRAILMLLLSASPFAFGGQGTGRVTFLLINRDQNPAWVVFNIQGYANHPCATPNGNLGKLIFTVDSTAGAQMLSLLLSAEARQIPITVVGAGACAAQNRESVTYLYVGDPAL